MSKRRELQAEWLEIWHQAGSPTLNKIPTYGADDSLKVIILESAVGDFGVKDYMLIGLGEYDVTELFAALAGYRGKKCKLYPVGDRQAIMRYQSKDCGRWSVEWLLVSQAIELQAAAAKTHLDVEALRATGAPTDELEARLIARASKRPRKKSSPKAL
jgi:hypothetical protein